MKILGEITSVGKKDVSIDVSSSKFGWYTLRIPFRHFPERPKTGQRLYLDITYTKACITAFKIDKSKKMLPPILHKPKPRSMLPKCENYNNKKSFQRYVKILRKYFHEEHRNECQFQ